VLEGISLGMVRDLAHHLRLPFVRRPIAVDEALAASECFLTTTPSCLLPVAKLNGQPIGNGSPGPIYRRLLRAWSDAVSVDLRAQAQRAAEAQG
jgi:branched-subunit amino acid aminotransferase/4-amino-4-deoxychorismate lyase